MSANFNSHFTWRPTCISAYIEGHSSVQHICKTLASLICTCTDDTILWTCWMDQQSDFNKYLTEMLTCIKKGKRWALFARIHKNNIFYILKAVFHPTNICRGRRMKIKSDLREELLWMRTSGFLTTSKNR